MAAPLVTPLVETQPHMGGFMISEARGHRARSQITILSGAGKLLAGTVLGAVTLGAVSAAIKGGGNTGNGVFTIDPTTPKVAGAKVGVYTARVIIAQANAGVFEIRDPTGIDLGVYIVGAAAFNNQIKFTIADGASDFIVGDGFDITIAAGSGKYVAFDPTALDGRQTAAGILWGDTDATSADKVAAALVRDAEVNLAELVWGAGVTTQPQKDAAFATFATVSLIGRTGL